MKTSLIFMIYTLRFWINKRKMLQKCSNYLTFSAEPPWDIYRWQPFPTTSSHNDVWIYCLGNYNISIRQQLPNIFSPVHTGDTVSHSGASSVPASTHSQVQTKDFEIVAPVLKNGSWGTKGLVVRSYEAELGLRIDILLRLRLSFRSHL